jgi:hypothetical protein
MADFIAIQKVNTGSALDKPLNQLINNMNAMIGSTDPRLQVVLMGAMQDSNLITMRDNGTPQPRVETAIPSLPGTLTMETLDYTKPPAITGLTANSAGHSVLLSWDLPINATYGHTVVYRATTNDFANAEIVGTTSSNVYPDPLGESSATRYYWVRQANKNDGSILSNLNATSGTSATTAQFGETDIGPNSITTGMIQALQITSGLIAANAVIAGKISVNAVTAGTVAAGAINATNILVNNIITANHMQANSITASNAAIANLAVTAGKIANLAVDTLQIANQAVTIPVSAYTSGSVTIGATWTTIQSAAITSTGAPIQIDATTVYTCGGGSSVEYLQMRLLRGVTQVWGSSSYVARNNYQAVGYATEYGTAALGIKDTPGSGSVTYYLQMINTLNINTSYAYNRSLKLLEVKK